MKINSLNNGLSKVARPDDKVQPVRKADRPTQASNEDRVSISDEARFLAELRDAATEMKPIRQDVVEQARADIEAGRLGTEEDMSRAIEALLMEL